MHPPTNIVVRVPITPAAAPATSTPSGLRLSDTSQSTDDARPSSSGGTSSCIIGLHSTLPSISPLMTTNTPTAATQTFGARASTTMAPAATVQPHHIHVMRSRGAPNRATTSAVIPPPTPPVASTNPSATGP
jgi:hypothetical protein